MQSSSGTHTVLVYNGEGAGSRSVLSTLETLRNSLSPEVKVKDLGPEELLAGAWQEECLMLVMPGGADLPYCRQLNGHGNRLIRGFVEAGGAYMGLCAGAYYACSGVEFALSTKLEVKGPRELAFFPGVAAGPVYAGFRYESEDGAHAARVAFRPPQPAAPVSESAVACGHCSQQESLVGSAASPEQRQYMLEAGSRDFASEATNIGRLQEGTLSPSVSAAEPDAGWLRCRDYTNGGPRFVPYTYAEIGGHMSDSASQLSASEQPNFERLAVYPDKGNALAAVRCSVGTGVAVLVGTHPELDPKWLSAVLDRVPALAEALKPQAADTVQTKGGDNSLVSANEGNVREQLEKFRAERRLFWRMLVQSAGMGKFLLGGP